MHLLPFRSALGAPVRVVADAAVTGNLASPLNFARFYLPRVLPRAVQKVRNVARAGRVARH